MKTPPWRRLLAACSIILSAACLPAVAAAANVDVTASPANPAPGDPVALVASAPAYTQSGAVTQEIIQKFDPTYLQLTGASDITAPEGWALSYSTDGSTFSPTTPSNWATVRAVKATGDMTADGSSGPRQIAVATQSVATPAPAPIAPGGGGDGWDVVFDDSGHVFNIFHHLASPLINLGAAITTGNGALDCHERSTGNRCAGTWPLNVNAMGVETTNDQQEWVDNTYDHLWFQTDDGTGNGFACIDISNIAAPAWCGGSKAAGFIRLGNATDVGTDLWGGNKRGDTTGNALLAASGTHLYTWERTTGKLLCLDMHANNGAGAECDGGSPSVAGVTSALFDPQPYAATKPTIELIQWDGRIYGSAGTGGLSAVCIVAATNTPCDGWPTAKTLSHFPYTVYKEPDANGAVKGVCFLTTAGAASCFDAQGNAFAGDSTLGTKMAAIHYGGGFWRGYGNPVTVGSRVYFNGDDGTNPRMLCRDLATNAYCSGWNGATGQVATGWVYTLQADPFNDQCIWSNSDGNGIKTRDADGNSPCSAVPSRVTMSANAIVPRLGCTGGGGITAWRTFSLTAPTLSGGASGATGATLTVRTADGTIIPGWNGVTIPSGSPQVDLTGLTVAASGQKPIFQVDFTGRGASALTTTATVTAVGEAPSLCLTTHAQAVTCPAEYGPPTSNLPWTATVLGDGSVTPQGGQADAYGEGSASVQATGTSTSSCVLPTPAPETPPPAAEPPSAVLTATPAPPTPSMPLPPAFTPPGEIVVPVTVPGPGKVTLVGTRGGKTRACTSITRTMLASGTTKLTCQINASTRAVLRTRAVRITVWAVYAPDSGTPSRVARVILIPRQGVVPVTG